MLTADRADNSHQIVQLDVTEATARLPELAEILVDAVASGASVSFMSPFTETEALAYWSSLLPKIAAQQIILLVALLNDRAVGTVQLHLATPPNQPHRAEVAKLLVHQTARQRGIAKALLLQLETLAKQQDRTLLTLDTLAGTVAERLYHSLGYCRVGVIPGYACLPTGELKDTVVFFKRIEP
ncbi:MAG TPA: GNAT family N-acetyltransferase [Trichocoleus sp.]|jgi:GNAT superfamily N-acetyltransferase